MKQRPTLEELEQRVRELEEEVSNRRENEAYFRLMFENAPLPYQSLDETGRFLDVNRKWLETMGYEKHEVIGRWFGEILCPESVEYFDRNFPMFKNACVNDGSEFEMVKKDGGIIRGYFNGWVQLDSKRQFVCAHCIFTDITDRNRMEQSLRESEGFRRTLLQTIPDMIWLKDVGGVYLACNAIFERFFGAKEEEIVGKTDYDFVEKDLADFFREHDRKAVAAGGPRSNEEWITFADDGHRALLETIKTPMFDDAGKLIGVLGIARDITERRELESRLQHAQKLESIGTLAGGIAHDFNNLLFPIQGLSEMLLETLPRGSEEHESTLGIYKAAQRASELVRQILSFSRQTDHRKAPLRIQRVLKEIVKLSRSTIPSNIVIHTEIQNNCGLVMADPVQVHQIAMNLITNAYHAVEETGGNITIRLSERDLGRDDIAGKPLLAGRHVALTISDTGCGIDPEVMDRIFEPYFTTKPKGKGTGLGLSMIYGIVKDHGGHIEVVSESGRGAEFIVYLPLMDIPSDKEKGMAPETIATGNERILLVDDEEVIARLEGKMLERLGYKVTMYTSSTDALAAFRSDPDRFDLVISDMTMPKMTGDRFAAELLSIRPGLPIIICTGFSEKLDMDKAEAHGIKGLLLKPVLKVNMAKMVREVLDNAK